MTEQMPSELQERLDDIEDNEVEPGTTTGFPRLPMPGNDDGPTAGGDLDGDSGAGSAS